MIDKLDKPLGRRRGKAKPPESKTNLPRLPIVPIAIGIMALVIGAPLAWIFFVDNPEGGRPVANVEVNSVVDSNELARNLTVEEQSQAEEPDTGVVEAGNSEQLIVNTDDLPDSDNAAVGGLVRKDMLELSQHGYIPQVASNGDRPVDVYARPSISASTADGKPLIAIVVTGLGLSKDGSNSAIDRLPDDFTLAFAPYGKSVAEIAGKAREGGHEVMLQVPLEPFDYPQNDPGPQTLLVGQSVRSNLDRLYWLMSQIQGYTGIINHMGAKFTSSSGDFEPIMEEIALRGLAYVDDGTSNRSVAPQLAQRSGADFAVADITLDDTPSQARILEQLSRLEIRAREKGHAIGLATVLPISVRTLTEWAQTLEDKGIILVPVSALYTHHDGS
ncbi:divergent polysaccharide deacetylase family protein [Maritalea porphyrae]|uniref:divergent polysaccharide deacetylase family protein n=1 Tax=Maritalea porphyrae TaxID=880732 RepID=UPI0022AFDF72|nr:divergent polysaccharide deacetylase family protein [Maritalea porphyrae]MCZ4271662.1 divergent polysaccharide deacetylase family protein [Maritalea porphyrae]